VLALRVAGERALQLRCALAQNGSIAALKSNPQRVYQKPFHH
jgi:hypothetical protein